MSFFEIYNHQCYSYVDPLLKLHDCTSQKSASFSVHRYPATETTQLFFSWPIQLQISKLASSSSSSPKSNRCCCCYRVHLVLLFSLDQRSKEKRKKKKKENHPCVRIVLRQNSKSKTVHFMMCQNDKRVRTILCQNPTGQDCLCVRKKG